MQHKGTSNNKNILFLVIGGFVGPHHLPACTARVFALLFLFPRCCCVVFGLCCCILLHHLLAPLLLVAYSLWCVNVCVHYFFPSPCRCCHACESRPSSFFSCKLVVWGYVQISSPSSVFPNAVIYACVQNVMEILFGFMNFMV